MSIEARSSSPPLRHSAPVAIPSRGSVGSAPASPFNSPADLALLPTPSLCSFPAVLLQSSTPSSSPSQYAVIVPGTSQRFAARELRLNVNTAQQFAEAHFSSLEPAASPPYQLSALPANIAAAFAVQRSEQIAGDFFEVCREKGLSVPLRELCKRLPKVDLHTHMEGFLTPEQMLELLVMTNLYYHEHSKTLAKERESKTSYRAPVEAKHLTPEMLSYIRKKIVMQSGDSDGYYKFFGRVCAWRGKIIEASNHKDILQRVIRYAKDSNITYMELMLELARNEVPEAYEDFYKQGMTSFRNNPELKRWVASFVEKSQRMLDEAEAHCQEYFKTEFKTNVSISDPDSPICIRYNLELMRTKDNYVFFAWLFAILELIKADRRIGGLTIVGPQNDRKAQENFSEQLGIITFLRSQYDPQPKLTYHAGELNGVLADPEFVKKELKTVLLNVSPDRIGHGCSVELTELMILAKKGVAVEVPLSGNHLLLNQSGNYHPLRSMLQAGVVVAFGNDNSGAYGVTPADDYLKAIMEHELRYVDLKEIGRNGLRKAFVDGDGIWNDEGTLKSCFQGMHDDSNWQPNEQAAHLLKSSPKARLQYKYEKDCMHFERVVVPQVMGE